MVELRSKPEEIMGVRWEPNVAQEFSVELRIELEHERGIIAVVASTVTEANANIERINMMEKDAHLGIVNVVINVQDRIHLAKVIKRLRTIKAINRIVRVKS
jgi:guanosine-3',5'-bis(diphosphate) 3'-pyrophosphohydrolase